METRSKLLLLEGDKNDLTNQVEELKKEKSDLQTKYNTLKSSYDTLNNEYKGMKTSASIADYKEDYSDMKQSQENYLNQIKQLKEQNAQLASELSLIKKTTNFVWCSFLLESTRIVVLIQRVLLMFNRWKIPSKI